MKPTDRQRISLTLALILLISVCLPGCTPKEAPVDILNIEYEGNVTLRVMIDDATSILFDNTFSKIADAFEDRYENVTIEVHRLSDYRKEYGSTEDLRNEIKTTSCVDIFILETDTPAGANYNLSLFPDVNLAMREGYFVNLSAYYDNDSDLNTAGLRQEVMDAGLVDGFQYTLPLTYDYPVVFVDREKLKDVGLDSRIFDKGIISVMDAVTELGDQAVARSASFFDVRYLFNFFPELVNYDTGTVLLDPGEMAKFLESYLPYLQLKGFRNNSDSIFPTDFSSIATVAQTDTWITRGDCMRVGWSLGDVIAETAIANHLDMNMDIYPLTGPDGKIVAEVRQYGAVNANCEYPDLAYAFLREFLTEENQWSQNTSRLRTFAGGSMLRKTTEIRGYPVRTKNSVEPLFYHAVLTMLDGIYIGPMTYTVEVMEAFQDQGLNNKSIPILQEHLDVVRFPAAGLEWKFATEITKEVEQNGWDPEAVDIETAVDTLISELEVYMWTE